MLRRIFKRVLQVIKEEFAWFKIRCQLHSGVARFASARRNGWAK